MFRDLKLTAFSARLLLVALCLAGWCAAASHPAAAEALTLSTLSADRLSTDLLIGDDLGIDLFGATSGVSYAISLTSDTGVRVAGLTAEANAEGEVPRQLLWRRSGVVGCDAGSEADPSLFRFRTFVEAEQHLVGRNFTLSVSDPQTGAMLTRVGLPLVEAASIRFYFSDACGCLRSEMFADEALFLSSHKFVASALPLRFLLVDHQSNWAVGSALSEVRQQFQSAPQQIFLPPGQISFSIEVWPYGSLIAGDYDGFARLAVDDKYVLRADDVLVGISSSLQDVIYPGGLVIRPTDDDPGGPESLPRPAPCQ